ncbi:MAG: SMP-30/gluconolactonase/LRE family protein, partial [Saprospiraceae bacterium]|nr:SMP-30/gluconolactonase/LRE family protein [Saprospiraceae bacterium]
HHQCQLGEGPVWDARRQEICWIDIIKGEIHQYNLANDTHRLYAVHEMIGCFALYPIKLPVSRVTSCTFGGEYLQDLFITSAREGLSESELEKQPLAGSLFVIRNCGFEGLPPFEFNY